MPGKLSLGRERRPLTSIPYHVSSNPDNNPDLFVGNDDYAQGCNMCGISFPLGNSLHEHISMCHADMQPDQE